MSKIDLLLAEYAAYHQTKGNVACHFVGIPLIIFGIFLLLQLLKIYPAGDFLLSGTEILILVSLIYYFVLDVRLAAGMLVVSVIMDLLARMAGDFRYGVAAFVIGWIFQAIGHIVYEKKSPAFLRNMVHLLVGPVFLLNEALHIRPVNLNTSSDSPLQKGEGSL